MSFVNNHILTLVTFFPMAAALFLLVIPGEEKKVLHRLAFVFSAVEFILSLHLYFHFQNTGTFEFLEVRPWIMAWNVHYLMGIDGVSLLLIVLTTLITPIALASAFSAIGLRVKEFVVWMLILETGMIGVFCALDLFLFYFFWEMMLIPMYLIIGIWGGQNRIYAAIKFFIYTMAGSVLMLIGILYLYFQAGNTFNLMELYEYRLPVQAQVWVFAAFALAFAIKVPLFPLHTWLPDAHVEAPTAGSVILAAILLKMGTYGFFRFAMPLFPDAFRIAQPILIWVAVFGIVYGALVAMVQTDMKKLIAYSSVSHMGVVMLGLFALNRTAVSGGLYQMLNHGISTGALFLLVGVLYERTHSRAIDDHSGLAKLAPWFATVFLVVTFSSIGLPLTNGFVGEFLSLAGAFQDWQWPAIIATTGVVLSAVYMLWLVQRVFFGETKVPAVAESSHPFHDLNR
ncbi:MAG: NADH-quinone oxidoreductase subunit M, partial [Deltaproteobacteria bacterium]|nr:NADH-quinone oxidoreductase subunit M [Deltaproteobacteria bacterium]